MEKHRCELLPGTRVACTHLPPILRRLDRRARWRRCAATAQEGEGKPRRGFDEGAAQVKRLIDRDQASFAGKGFEDLMKRELAVEEKAGSKGQDGDSESETLSQPPSASDDKSTPASPFGSAPTFPFSSGTVDSPFGFSEPSKPFDDTGSLRSSASPELVEDEPWWSFVNNITITQIVLFCSFSLIITIMLGTFWFVLNAGGVHFNE